MTGPPQGETVHEPVYPPRLLTRRGVIATVAERWRAQYYRDGTWGRCRDGSAQIIYDKLVAIDLATAPRAPVDAAIGNSCWTAIQCDGCQRDVEVAAEVGQLPGYDSATVTLCASCITLAAQLLETTERA